MNIELLTPLVNSYLSKSDSIDKKTSMEAALLSINESLVALNHLKKTLKENVEKTSIANYLSICLSMSEYAKIISQTDCYLKNPKLI